MGCHDRQKLVDTDRAMAHASQRSLVGDAFSSNLCPSSAATSALDSRMYLLGSSDGCQLGSI